jgi:hypothetical protein
LLPRWNGRRAWRDRVFAVASWDDLRRVALGLPEAEERTGSDGLLSWHVRKKAFVWERPLRRGDHAALGDAAPQGPIACARVPDLGAKEALLAEGGGVYFTTPHFDGYPMVLFRLDSIAAADLDELLAEAWLASAPKRLAKEYLDALS